MIKDGFGTLGISAGENMQLMRIAWFPDWKKRLERVDAFWSRRVSGLVPGEFTGFIENMRPEGLWLDMPGINGKEEVQAVIDLVTRWK